MGIDLVLPLMQAQAAQGQLMSTFVMFGIIIAIFYFLIIRPQNKKQKETKAMLANLKKGDQVVSIGGIHGKVQSVDEDSVIVLVDEGLKLKFQKSAISTVVDQKKETAKDGEQSGK